MSVLFYVFCWSIFMTCCWRSWPIISLIMSLTAYKGPGFHIAMLAHFFREQQQFASWQTAGRNDEWSSAYFGLQQVSLIALPIACSLASHTPSLWPRKGRSWHQFVNPGGMTSLICGDTWQWTRYPRMIGDSSSYPSWDSNLNLFIMSSRCWPQNYRSAVCWGVIKKHFE